MTKWLLKGMMHVCNGIMLPVLRFCARKLTGESGPQQTVAVPYVEADSQINPLVVWAAFNEPLDQGRLNACMETIRNADFIKTATQGLYMHLMASGCPMEEAIVRCAANVMYLGMNVERRLSSFPADGADGSLIASPEAK